MADDVTINSEKLDNFLSNASNNVENISKKIIEELAELALSEMQNNYSKSEYRPSEYMDFSKTGTDTEKKVSMSGPQAVYSEFGTGTRGGMHPHPKKSDFDLNPYNSGSTIRSSSNIIPSDKVAEQQDIPPGTLYWTFQGEDGQIYYTQGIPAQKQVYDAGRTVQKKISSVIKKNLKEMF